MMMNDKITGTGSIQLDPVKPTSFTFSQLHHWVIWQMTRKKGEGLSGAVHPSTPDSSWYPAVIKPKEKRVKVYGHLDTKFESPEEAAEWLIKQH
ncbi:MAG: hypothetical protein R6X34_22550 [Chloroflexota bacterium]